MADIEQAIAPPRSNAPVIETGVMPPPEGAQSGVAGVQLNYDPGFKEIARNVLAPTPEGNQKTADIIKTRTKEAEVEDPNRSMQAGKMFISLLQGKIGEAYKWYNGGGVTYDEGRDVKGNPVWVGRTERGKTTEFLDWETKRPLTADERKAIIQRGGVTTENDLRAERSANWQIAQSAMTSASKGFESQLIASRTKAMAAANEGTATNKNIDQEVGLALKLKNVLNTMANMDPQQRQAIMGYANRYKTNSENLRKNAETRGGVTVGDQTQVGAGLQGSVSPPAGSAGGGANLSAGQQVSVSGAQANAEARGRENTIQEQQTLQNAIMQASLGSIKDSTQFAEFMRLIDLNNANNASNQDIPADVQPPGWRKVPPADVFTGGLDTLLENRYSQQANNTLISAYNTELYKAQREMAETGKVISTQDIYNRFKDSDMAIGAVNYARDKIYRTTGRGEKLKNGELVYRKHGKIEAHQE
jgi:hypothetical protein